MVLAVSVLAFFDFSLEFEAVFWDGDAAAAGGVGCYFYDAHFEFAGLLFWD
jgi:hypothetical protein